jgi:hypothetical protein
MSMQNAAWGQPSSSTTSGLAPQENRNGLLSPGTANNGVLRHSSLRVSNNEVRNRAARLGLLEQEPAPRRASALSERRTKSCLSTGKKMDNLTFSKSNVSFDKMIEIREHPRTLGDNPSVSRGPPLALDWYDEKLGNTIVVELDQYEESRSTQRRSKADLVLSNQERESILTEEVGVTARQLVMAMKEATKVKQMRRETNTSAHMEQTHVFLESAARKFQRLVRKRSSTKREIEELWKRASAQQDLQLETKKSLPTRSASMPSTPALRRNSRESSRPRAKQKSKDDSSLLF